MGSKCGSLGKRVLSLSSGCMVLSGGIQMVGALALANSVVMLLLLLAGFWSFISGLSLMVTGSKGYIGGHSQTSRRRKLHCVRLVLVLTTIILAVAIILVHLERIRIIDPWSDDVISSRRTLKYASLSQAFDNIGIWVVTVTSITGAIASLCALASVLPCAVSKTFSLHSNLATVESIGWVYEPTPKPDVLENCPSHRLPQALVSPYRHKSRKPALKSKSVTLVSFKHGASLNRQTTSLPTRTSKGRKIVFVDSWHLAPTLPLNMNFGNMRPTDSPRSEREKDLPTKCQPNPSTKCPPSPSTKCPPSPSTKCPPSPSTKCPPSPSTKCPPSPWTRCQPRPSIRCPSSPTTRCQPVPSVRCLPGPSTRCPPIPSTRCPPNPSTRYQPNPSARCPPSPSTRCPPSPAPRCQSKPYTGCQPSLHPQSNLLECEDL
ncbi:proteoglycan 4-like [Macrobrachium rosenbergii]|uniref:proteoglycan 4-like n=1 Tax=Macrobrachium rosenbergii TaxID=79674 RepID=UPI0034D3CFD1